ncbi:SDR family oxidoreductase [Streptomyces sp. SPB074]|uniref:SDR family oxidoreductase n=1 Tax=Streptomyces sp. (strain SPB074) TaxID=465543 RepID=UPI00017F2982|nr:NAD(P)H-binding protein [Streptomyces sp. SPB074]EDY45382.1 secreted protein [Streptomyces sp. SPB074]
MKVGVIGGTGRVGARLIAHLRAEGHQGVALVRSAGVDVTTGEGLREGLAGCEVCVNVSTPPAFDGSALDFQERAMAHMLDAGRAAGTGHFVVLSIVGCEEVPQVPYYAAKAWQERALADSGVPWSVLRATQFHEFVPEVMDWTTERGVVRLPSTPLQPVAVADVVNLLVEVVLGPPTRARANLAGPESFALDDLARHVLARHPDGRAVVTDEEAGLFAAVPGRELTAPRDATIGPTTFDAWLRDSWPA